MEKFNIVPMGLLSAFTLKLLAFGSTFSEAAIVTSLCAVVYGTEYLSKSRRIQKVEHNNKTFQETLIKKLEDQVHVINKQNEVIKAMAVEIDQIRGSISSVKMAQGMTTMKKVGS